MLDGGKWVNIPKFILHRHDIGVVEQHERPLVAGSRESTAHRDSAWTSLHVFALVAFGLEEGGEKTLRRPVRSQAGLMC